MNWLLSEFLNELDVRGQTWCIIECDEAGGFSAPPDDRLRFYAVLDGTVRVAGVSPEAITLGQGEVVIILSGHAHALRARPDSSAASLDFMREGSYDDVPPTLVLGKGGLVVSRVLCGRLKVRWPAGVVLTSLPPILTLHADQTIVQLPHLRHCTVGAGAAGLLTGIAAVMLAQALRCQSDLTQKFPLTAAEDPIARALQLVQVHPSQPWTVASLAQKIGMGRSNFATQFVSATGSTPMEKLAERRMQFAVELLQQRRHLKVSEIAAKVGYRSQAAFIRRFVREFGTTPGMLRRDTQADGTGEKGTN